MGNYNWLKLKPDLGHYRAVILCGMWAKGKGVCGTELGQIKFAMWEVYLAHGHKPDLGPIINGLIGPHSSHQHSALMCFVVIMLCHHCHT